MARPARHELNADWYRTKYSLAAVLANRYADRPGEWDSDRRTREAAAAWGEANELMQAASTTAVWLRARRRRSRHAALERFLTETMLPSAGLLLAGAMLHVGKESLPARYRDVQKPSRDRREVKSSWWRRAVRRFDAKPRDATREELVERIAASKPTEPRVLYNHACYLATRVQVEPGVHEDWQRQAVEQLEQALHAASPNRRRTLADAAKRDGSLKPLQDRDDFRRVTDAALSAPEIEDTWRRDLRAALVEVLRANPKMTAEGLAAHTGLPPAYVDRVFKEIREEAGKGASSTPSR